RLQAVLAPSVEDALGAIRRLAEKELGRATFLITGFDAIEPEAPSQIENDKEAENLIEVLGLDKRLEHVFRLALPDIAQARIAPDLETALKRSSADPNTTFVTLNGEIVRAESLIVTGAGDARKTGVLLLKREIKELTAKSALLCGRREESLSIVTSLRNRITELEEKRTGIADQIRDGEKILRQREDEKREFERELARAEQHIRVVQSETDAAE